MRLVFLKHETLQWLMDRRSHSPEDDIISMIDGDEDPEPPLPALDGVDEDLIWIWRCREMGLPWKDIAPMLGLRTPAGAWKRFNRLLREAQEKAQDAGKKRAHLLGEEDATHTS